MYSLFNSLFSIGGVAAAAASVHSLRHSTEWHIDMIAHTFEFHMFVPIDICGFVLRCDCEWQSEFHTLYMCV